MPCCGERLCEALSLVVDAPRTDRIHVAPVVLTLRVCDRVSVDLAGGGEDETRIAALGEFEGPLGAMTACGQGVQRAPKVLSRRCGTGQVSHRVERICNRNAMSYVSLDELKAGTTKHVLDV